MRIFAARRIESLRGKLIISGPLWRGRDVQIRFSTAAYPRYLFASSGSQVMVVCSCSYQAEPPADTFTR
jgi:hypothetical protein